MSETATEGIQDYLRQLTPQTRSRLLTELERLRLCNDNVPGSDPVLTELRKEFAQEGQPSDRLDLPARRFFEPLEPFLLNRPPEQARAGRISRGSLTAVWDLITRDLMQSLAVVYADDLKRFIAGKKNHEAGQAVKSFQGKAAKYLEGVLGSEQGVKQTRKRLAVYTSMRGTVEDVCKMLCALNAREALAEFDKGLPEKIKNFDDAWVEKVWAKLDAFVKRQPKALPFAMALIMNRLKQPWQLIRLATKAAETKEAAEIAETPYAIAVTLVLDWLEEMLAALRDQLKANRIPIAKDIMVEIYDLEYALNVRIDGLDESDWGKRLAAIMATLPGLLEAEFKNMPEGVKHIFGSSSIRRHDSLAGQLTWFAWKCRDALSDGAAYCRNLVGSARG